MYHSEDDDAVVFIIDFKHGHDEHQNLFDQEVLSGLEREQQVLSELERYR